MESKTLFAKRLARDRPVVLDGGLSTQCEAMGCDISGRLWSAALLMSEPEAIVAASRAFLEAGAEIIATCSYQGSRGGFAAIGLSAEETNRLLLTSVALADRARAEYLLNHPRSRRTILIAASIGPYGAALADGSEYSGDYGVSASELREFHADRLALFDRSGADVLACETIPSLLEAEVLAELLRDLETPAWVSFSCRDDTAICDGTPIAEAVRLFKNHPRVLAVGVNCTPPQFMRSLIKTIKAAVPDLAIVVYPNSGETYDASTRSWYGTATATEWSEAAKAWVAAGARLIGGCCRTGPEHIRAIAAAV